MPGVAGVLGAQQVQQLPARLVLGHDPVLDVGPVEAGHEVPGAGQVQPGRRSRRGWPGWRSRSARSGARPASARAASDSAEVVGPEVVAPLGHAVRLVDREQRDRAAVEQPQRSTRCAAAPAPGRAGPARRPGTRPRPRGAAPASWVELRKPARTPSARSASTWSCISAISGEMTTPVPRPDQRRDLVAQRLAAAGRHQHQRVAAADDVLDDLLLAAAEGVVAEHPAQHLRARRSAGSRCPGGNHPATLRVIGVTRAALAATRR